MKKRSSKSIKLMNNKMPKFDNGTPEPGYQRDVEPENKRYMEPEELNEAFTRMIEVTGADTEDEPIDLTLTELINSSESKNYMV